MDEDGTLTVKEVAEENRVHVQTVRRWIKHDGLKATKLGDRAGYRIKESDLQAFFAAMAVKEDHVFHGSPKR